MITVVLGVSFVYSYLISTRQTREIIDDELYSEHFREHYLPKAKELAQEMMIDTFNNNDLINGIGDLSSRLEEVERALDRLEANPKPTNTRLVKKATKKAVKKKATK